MREQLADGDLTGPRQVGDEFRHPVVERQLALLLQEEDGGGGELLADRADAVPHPRRRRRARVEPRVPIGFDVGDLAVLNHRQRGARHAALGERVRGQLVYPLAQLGGELRLRGRGKARESQDNDRGEAVTQCIRSAH